MEKYHIIDVKNLMPHISPFECWLDIDKPICKKDVYECINKKEYKLVDTNLNYNEKRSREEIYWDHVRKISYFVVHGFEKPISIDVGLLGYIPSYIILDGNHRLLSSIINGKKTIKADISGSINRMKEMNLWNR